MSLVAGNTAWSAETWKDHRRASHKLFFPQSHTAPRNAAAAPAPTPKASPPKPSPRRTAGCHMARLTEQRSAPVREDFTFTRFVVGAPNGAAAGNVAMCSKIRSGAITPLFIFGPKACGKTHLLSALVNALREKGIPVLHCTADHFAKSVVPTEAGRKAIKAADFLVIDDLQILAASHGLDALEEVISAGNSPRLVAGSTVAPARLTGVSKGMLDQFLDGRIIEIEHPNLLMKRAVAEREFNRWRERHPDATVPEDVLDLVAIKVTTMAAVSVAVERLFMLATTERHPITLARADRRLADLWRVEAPPPTVDAIKRATSIETGVTVPIMESARRHRGIIRPRQIAMYLCRQLTQRSLPEIGHRFGGRDHTTVLHAIRKIKAEVQADPNIASTIRAIEIRLGVSQ